MELCDKNNYDRTTKLINGNRHYTRRFDRFMKFLRYKKKNNERNTLSFEMNIDEESKLKLRRINFTLQEMFGNEHYTHISSY